MRAAGLLAVWVLMAAPGEQAAAPLRTVERVDIGRYLGDWFEVARFPNRFQRQCVGGVRASYGARADGRIDVVTRCRTERGEDEARGVARIVDPRSNARLKVRFAPGWLSWLPKVWGDYWIIGLADDYSWAVVGSPDRQYLWIVSRTPELGAAAFDRARAIAESSGFDVDRLSRTPR